MNFLELCQRAALESGTVNSATSPAAVTGQTLRLAKVINWTAQAWIDIQNLHSSWRWMRSTFTGTLSINTTTYTAASFSIDRFAEWIRDDHLMTMYKTSLGVSDEGEIPYEDYDWWLRKYDRGTQTANRPTEWSITHANEIVFGVKPDVAYTVRGPYRKSPQILALNTDIPEMPVRFHSMIWRKALMLLHGHDEGAFALANIENQYLGMLEELERDQLPRVIINSPALA